MKKLQGLIAAAHTPFDANGAVNDALVRKQAETLIRQKVTGVYISGTTGEGVSCSVDERKRVMDAWAAFACRTLRSTQSRRPTASTASRRSATGSPETRSRLDFRPTSLSGHRKHE